MKIELDQTSGKLKLAFAYNKEMVAAIKELPDRRFNPETKEWAIGFDSSNLEGILALLAGNNWPPEVLDRAAAECKEYLAAHPDQMTEDGFKEKIIPPMHLMADLVFEAYMAGRINQQQQGDIIAIINHLSLKDFIRK